MKCLNEQQFMELLYRDGEQKQLEEYKNHILECKHCMSEFLELLEARNYLAEIKEDRIQPEIIVLEKKSNGNLFSKLALIAASLVLGFSILFSTYQIKKIERKEKQIAMMSHKLQKQIEEVSYKTEKIAKDNYLLIMGLKNYIDSAIMNQQNTRRVNYEKF